MRPLLGLFMGAIVGTGLWLVWLSVVGYYLSDPVLRLLKPLSPVLSVLLGSFLVAVVAIPPALFLARLGGRVAARMALIPQAGRSAIVLALVLDSFLFFLFFLFPLALGNIPAQ